MSFDRAKAAVAGTRFSELRWVAETGSTNADVLDLLADAAASDPAAHGDLVLVAGHQSAGRGRLDRIWDAPEGSSLLMTIGTLRDVPPERRGLLVSAVSCAALWAVTEVAGVTLRLKWPNDLVAVGIGDPAGPNGGDRKVAGVLAEATQVAGGRTATAIGVGVNCNWGAMPEELADIGTSLDLLCGRAVDTEELAATIVRGFDDRQSLLDTAEGAATLVAEARAHSATLGRRVHVELPGAGFEGTAAALAADGALEVTLDDGSTRTVLAGDLVHLRPA